MTPMPDLDVADSGRPAASCAVDRDGTVTAWGGDAFVLLGYAAKDAVGRHIDDLLQVPADLLPWAADTGWTVFAPVRDRGGDRLDALWCAEPLATADRDQFWAVRVVPQEAATRHSTAPGGPPEQDHSSRRRLAMVYEASLRIGNTLDVFRTADELAQMSTEEFADYVTVDLLEQLLTGDEVVDPAPEGSVVLRRTAQRSVLDGCPEAVVALGDKHAYPQDSPAGRTLATGHGFRQQVNSSTLGWWSASPERQTAVQRYGIHSALVVPLRARGVTLGLAMFCRHRTREPYEADDLGVAEELARRAAVCVDNARRYTRERATAVMLQRSLLPGTLASPTAVETAARYRPAGSRSGAGGDWYDVIPLSGARVALVVGDVVGHGLRAAAAMGRLRAAVRTLADIDLPPDEVLTRLDDVITRLGREAAAVDGAGPEEQGLGEMSATCLYAVYDPVSRYCWMASAGHPPPAVVTPEGEVTFADVPIGPPLGIGGLPFEAINLRLAEGSLMEFYTDGLVKVPGSDVDEAMETMRTVLRAADRPLQQTCDLLLRTLLTAPPTDDVALLLVRTRALSADNVMSWDVSDDPAEVAGVRRRASDQLSAWGLDEAAFTMELVISELVTNAIRHGRQPVRLRLIKDDASLFCEVSDGSNTAPHLRRARVLDEGGRGLLLVAQLTDRWGTRQTPVGKIIWTENDLTSAPTPTL
ncbi:SpoIIE family protein phosphatase [Streptomyces sp. PRB2-1]|jgi:serine phosphatase RsbU (regulator of sigma subunit)/anti-sigma regulatory factor (Ser/Thr protein kinase)|uniref:SpoIIE family protein phosphatase n=2 Tax=Actinacidiphila epipremni TaxID=2053013 RepID=A0ABX0ZR47_9ACTN|nr:SpoIIE family protein phosphatase [Actinacidiphila epipremni]